MITGSTHEETDNDIVRTQPQEHEANQLLMKVQSLTQEKAVLEDELDKIEAKNDEDVSYPPCCLLVSCCGSFMILSALSFSARISPVNRRSLIYQQSTKLCRRSSESSTMSSESTCKSKRRDTRT